MCNFRNSLYSFLSSLLRYFREEEEEEEEEEERQCFLVSSSDSYVSVPPILHFE